jgi:hypothetical protein
MLQQAVNRQRAVVVSAGPVQLGQISMGAGDIGVTNRYLTRAGRPWLPVSGEFHFSRYPRELWEEELLKIKAGGVTAVASYLFWLHHEEAEGAISFAGNLDVRHFVELCARHGLDFVARIGPWVHAEARNGGLPDWVLANCVPRSDDPTYLARVRGWYSAVAQQLHGLDHASGGPIISIQIDNEYHGGAGHLGTLKRLAVEAGLEAPLWTATAWGGVRLPGDELLPLYGGYPEAFWFGAEEDWHDSCRIHFIFSHDRDDPGIGADLRGDTEQGALPDPDRHPFLTCELGGGMGAAYHRRPVVDPHDVAALALTELGSGVNWLGYYLYHGGTNPIGRLSTFQESHATGYPNDMPVLTYDFQAPLGEYGQYRRHYHELRRLHLMLADFGDLLAPMPMTLPDTQSDGLYDRDTLRWAVRSDGSTGFLFVNNHQPHEQLPAHHGVRFELELAGASIMLPSAPVRIPTGAYFCWPVNLPVADLQLAYATAQPICLIEGDRGPVLVLAEVDGIVAELAFAAETVADVVAPSGERADVGAAVALRGLRPGSDCLVTLHSSGGTEVGVLVLDAAAGRRLYRGEAWGRPRLVLSADGVVFDGDTVRLHTDPDADPAEISFSVYPAPDTPPVVAGAEVRVSDDGVFTRYTVVASQPAAARTLPFERLRGPGPVREIPTATYGGWARDRASAPTDEDFDRAAVYLLDVPAELLSTADEVLLRLDWVGDVARAYRGNRLVADTFYRGEPWELSLTRLGPGPLELRLLPLRPDAPVYLPPSARPVVDPSGHHGERGAAVIELRHAAAVRTRTFVVTVTGKRAESPL